MDNFLHKFGNWILEFRIWNFHSTGMALFLKIVRKDPFIFRAYYFEAYFAIGTEDKIPRFLGSFKRDISITDRTFHFLGHERSPLSLLEALLFEIQKKIKSLPPFENVKELILSAIILLGGWVDFRGENRRERGLNFFSCILIHIYMKMMMSEEDLRNVWIGFA